jgi:predicted transcriptional regulator
MHLKRLENAGLVTSQLELSDDGKAMNYYEIKPFSISLSPEKISEAAKTLTPKKARDTASKVKNKGENYDE